MDRGTQQPHVTHANCDHLCFYKYEMHTPHIIRWFSILCHLTLNELFVELWSEQPKGTDLPLSLVGEG